LNKGDNAIAINHRDHGVGACAPASGLGVDPRLPRSTWE
jgi:hypothetical protein